MARRITAGGARSDKIRIVPDTIDANELAPVRLEGNRFRKEFAESTTFAVVHTGNMGKKQDLGLLLRAAVKMRQDPGVHFYVFGDGAAKAAFLEERAARNLGNVSHHMLQPRSMLTHMLSGADVVLVSQVAEVGDIVVPSKLITAMAAGAMIVAACSGDSETAQVVTQSGGGVIIDAGDDEALVVVINRIRCGEIRCDDYRRKARAYAVSRFDREGVYGAELDLLLRKLRSAGPRQQLATSRSWSAKSVTEKESGR